MLLHQKNSYKLIECPGAKVWKEKRLEGKKKVTNNPLILSALKKKENKNPRHLASATWVLLMHLIQCRQLLAEEGASLLDIPCFSAKESPAWSRKAGRHCPLFCVLAPCFKNGGPPMVETLQHLPLPEGATREGLILPPHVSKLTASDPYS